jgi:predicted ribonuclease YlaK
VPTSAARSDDSQRNLTSTGEQPGQPRRTYVLDTSVLLADPAAIGRFAEHRVIVPVVVITELEAKRHHPELGYFARQALRSLDDLRIEHGRLDADLPVGDDGGTVRVELNHSDPSVLPAGFRLGDNDTRILSVARSLAAEGERVVLVSKDLPLRVKAAAIGLTSQEYRAELPVDSGWTGMSELDVTAAEIDELYESGKLECEAALELPCHTGLVPRERAARWAGCSRTSRCAWSGVIVRCSACAAAAPSSGSRSTCCSTLRSGSCRWAAGRGQGSRRSPCARDSRP